MTTSPTPSTPKPAAAVCEGDGCESRDTWPLHRMSHRGNLSHLCSSCVLRYNPGSFCSICFDLFPKSQPRHRPLVHCSRCPMMSHLFCLPNPNLASQFVCPSCKDSNSKGYLYFPNGKRRMGDNKLGEVFLAAARLAADSMRLAAVKVREEAKEKVKVSVNARKRARELLENAILLCKKEKEKEMEGALASVPKAEETKRKVARVQNREFEKWVRFHEPIPKLTGAVTNGFGLEEKKGKAFAAQSPRISQASQGHAELKGRFSSGFGSEDKEKNVNLVGSRSEGRSLVGGDEKVLRVPPAAQEVKSGVVSGLGQEDKEKKGKALGCQNGANIKEDERRWQEGS